MAVPVTADLATADLATADLETEAETDRSIEQAFFARAMVLSYHPVSFDTDSGPEPLDLEGRERRRAHFTRLVGMIVGTLGIGVLFALTRSGAPFPEPALIAAAPASRPELARIEQEEPTEILPLELTADEPVVTTTVAPLLSAMLPAKAIRVAPSSTSRPPVPVPRSPAATLVPAQIGERLPPTARFAD